MKKYNPEYYYHRWLAIHLHFTQTSFDINKFPRAAIKTTRNERILSRLKRLCGRFPAHLIDKAVIGNYVEHFYTHREASSGWMFESLEFISQQAQMWQNAIRHIEHNTKFFLEEYFKDTKKFQEFSRKYDLCVADDAIEILFERKNNHFFIAMMDEIYKRDKHAQMFAAGMPRPEVLVVLNNHVEEIERTSLFSSLEADFCQKWSFPNFQKELLFLQKYAMILPRIEKILDW